MLYLYFSAFESRGSFYGNPLLLPFALLSWGVVYLLFCSNIFLNIRIFFFAGARRFYAPPDNVFGHLPSTLCAAVDILSCIDLDAFCIRRALKVGGCKMLIVSWEGSFLEFYYLSYVLIKMMSLYYNIR